MSATDPVWYPHPVIAIVGRPNVGKSTLFNRLIGTRKAVVSPLPGTTRDRVYGQAEWRGRPLTLIDTGGFDLSTRDGLAPAIQQHITRALHEADAFLFLCDARQGLVPMDAMVMDVLRKTGKPIILVANKADQQLSVPPEMFSLGLAPVFPISALHGRGVGELLEHAMERVPAPPDRLSWRPGRASSVGAGPASVRTPVAIAIVGRQNVGKSSLLNALLREDRVIVSEVPGTTRDAIDTYLVVNETPVVLIDTAGLRHRRKVTSPVDLFAMSRSLDAIGRCDVTLVILDGTQGVTRDDLRLLRRVMEVGCGFVLLVNKWDLVRSEGRESGSRARAVSAKQVDAHLKEAIRRAAPFAASAPVLAISAKTGFQVSRSLAAALRIHRMMREGLPEQELLSLLQEAWAAQPPPRIRGGATRLQQACWRAGRPCRVVLSTSPVGRLPLLYERYLLKRLSMHPRLSGVPLKVVVQVAQQS